MSKFGENRSRTELTMLAVRSRRMDGHRTDAKVILYSIQCCTLHWTENNVRAKTESVQCLIEQLK